MNRRLFLASLLVFATTSALTGADRPPNIVLILADDLGWSDPGCYGNRFHETPHIDGLAAAGMRFTDYYAPSPVCSSTRASLLVGQTPPRTGITRHIGTLERPFERMHEPKNGWRVDHALTTYVEMLRARGYSTGHVGKWHLQVGVALQELEVRGFPKERFSLESYPDEIRNDPGYRGRSDSHLPTGHGFDLGVTTPAGGTHFFPLRVRGYDEPLPAEGAYLADFLTDLAVRFIEEHRKGPFFLELNHLIPHWRIEAKERTIAKYRAKPKPLSGTNNPKYAAMFEHLDDSVGRVLKTIERLGLSEKTIVVFTSDNGAIYFRPNGEGADGAITTNAPLRGEKGSLYEGGIRVPQIVRWSKVVPPGTLTRTPAIGMDLLPTFAEVSGATLPDQSLDGVSLVPVLSGTGTLQRRDLFWHYPHYHHDEPSGAIREGDWKLKESYVDGGFELFNLRHDLSETRNLAARYPMRAEQLRSRLSAWRKSVGAQMPTPNPEYDPARAHEFWKAGRLMEVVRD